MIIHICGRSDQWTALLVILAIGSFGKSDEKLRELGEEPNLDQLFVSMFGPYYAIWGQWKQGKKTAM